MTEEQKIKQLRPKTQIMCLMLKEEAKKQGIEIVITNTLRSLEEQGALFSQGREVLEVVNRKRKLANMIPITAEENKKIVTKVNAGHSAHNYGLAFDFIVKVNGKCTYDRRDLFVKVGMIAETIKIENYSLTWGGDFDRDGDMKDEKFIDLPHVQLTNWKNYK